jgi:hypothetical protein
LRAFNLQLCARQVKDWDQWRNGSGAELDLEAVDRRLFRAIGIVRNGQGELGASPWTDLAVFWAVIALFAADDRYSLEEQDWIRSRFGARRSEGAMRFIRHFRKESTARALAKFRDYCPRIRDSRRILRSAVREVLLDAAQVAGAPGGTQREVLKECLRVLGEAGSD